jgi:hypothetical protein
LLDKREYDRRQKSGGREKKERCLEKNLVQKQISSISSHLKERRVLPVSSQCG